MELSKMFGVERDTDFMVKGYSLIFQINLYTNNRGEAFERLVSVGKNGDIFSVSPGMAYLAIHSAPSGIIHLPPPLTEEERSELNTFFALGGRWITKDGGGWVQVFNVKPMRSALGNWVSLQSSCSIFIAPGISKNLRVAKRISDCAQEPFDIGKALEVTGEQT